MENVPQLARYNKNGVYAHFIDTLKKNNYFISDPQQIVNCPGYGVPQNRKRLVLFASKFGTINLMRPLFSRKNYPTVKTAIGNLPKIKDGEICKIDPLHRAQKLSELNKKRIRLTKEGGSWRNWPDELKLDCHKKISGTTFGDVYGRMKWNKPSPTLTTHCIGLGNGRFGHPEQHRAISLREAALLQSFPKQYKFIDDTKNEVISKDIQRHVGNAVPVKLAQAIAKSIKYHLKEKLN